MLAQWTGQSCYDKIAHWHDLQGDSWALASLRDCMCSACQLEATSQSYEFVFDWIKITIFIHEHGISTSLSTDITLIFWSQLFRIEPGAHLTTKMAIARFSVVGHDSVLGNEKLWLHPWWWFCATLAVKMQGDRENGVFFGFKTARDLETKERLWWHHDCDGFRQAPELHAFYSLHLFFIDPFCIFLWSLNLMQEQVVMLLHRLGNDSPSDVCCYCGGGIIKASASAEEKSPCQSDLYAIQFLEPSWKLRQECDATCRALMQHEVSNVQWPSQHSWQGFRRKWQRTAFQTVFIYNMNDKHPETPSSVLLPLRICEVRLWCHVRRYALVAKRERKQD